MTRINTNVGSLIAQKTLSRTSDQLQTALTRLSTGLRINSGKDDPAGLIASENLRRDITSANTAIGNSQQAGQLIATADSALGQISNLLNDIRGLAVQAANTGVLSDEQIAANQLQVDASLEAIDRIAKVTTYQGRKLLDGSLEFSKEYTAGGTTVADLTINAANLGTAGSLAVNVNISSAATQAVISNNSFPTTPVAQATGTITLTNTAESFDLTAVAGGAADEYVGNSTDVVLQSGATTGAAYDATTNTLTVTVAAGATVGDITNAIDAEGTFVTSNVSNAATVYNAADNGTIADPLSGGVGAGLAADLVVRIGGDKGSEVFEFRQGATLAQVVDAVNLVSDGTGVQAVDNGGALELQSTSYGSNGFVDVEVLSEGTGGLFSAGLSGTHAAGTDIEATVNGATASGNGNTLSVHTSTLDLSLTVDDGSSTAVSFNITGGGAVFQLGPNVVTNQQARIGISSVNTGTLGGTDGRLYELRSGYGKDLQTNPNGATLIVDEAINKVTGIRGRLGAFQRTTIDTNIAALKDTVTNLTEAESQIRDADFAAETAALTRAQVLTQSGMQVLAIANQQPQNVLALLRNI